MPRVQKIKIRKLASTDLFVKEMLDFDTHYFDLVKLMGDKASVWFLQYLLLKTMN